jgi:hypothetical protein
VAAVRSLIAARTRGDRESLQALAVALVGVLDDTPTLPTDPVAVYEQVENQSAERQGTWQEVRAARDYGDLTPAEYDYLAAAVAALTQEDD